LDGITAHVAGKKLQEEAERDVLSQWQQWVKSQVDDRKMGVLLEQEQADWKWSPLFRALRKLADLPLRY
jgi:hypothetical protein